MESRSYFGSAVVPFRLVFIMWLVFSFEMFYGIDLSGWGLIPRSARGLIGIFTAPMLHGNAMHLLSNTVPLLFLGGTLFFFYNKIGTTVFFRCYFVTNILVWLFGRPGYTHIGASGLIFGLAAFLISFGILRRDTMSILISIVVIILYGGIFYGGLMATDPRISVEMHLSGTIVGVATAFMLRHTKRV
ncbi:MAG: rhomboid family intramembrane serine protease [Bacteroidota bacterium]